jgi:hypothetical protein
MKRLFLSALLVVGVLLISRLHAEKTVESRSGPNCSGGWPTNMTFIQLKNAGLADNNAIDFSKTKTVRMASEKTGKDLWRQVYHVTFAKKDGGSIDAIAVHDASEEECSMSGVEVFVISTHLNPERK